MMQYLILLTIFVFNFLNAQENLKYIKRGDEYSLDSLQRCYLINTSAFDTIIKPNFITSKYADLRSFNKFKKLKDYVENVKLQKSYFILINKGSFKPCTIFSKIDNENIIPYAEFTFITYELTSDLKNPINLDFFYYKNDTIVSHNYCCHSFLEKPIKNQQLNFIIDEKHKPEFMFEVALIHHIESREKVICNFEYFWRFKADCKFQDYDYFFYEKDSYFLFNLLRDLNRFGIFTDKFGNTDYDYGNR